MDNTLWSFDSRPPHELPEEQRAPAHAELIRALGHGTGSWVTRRNGNHTALYDAERILQTFALECAAELLADGSEARNVLTEEEVATLRSMSCFYSSTERNQSRLWVLERVVEHYHQHDGECFLDDDQQRRLSLRGLILATYMEATSIPFTSGALLATILRADEALYRLIGDVETCTQRYARLMRILEQRL